MKSINLAVEMMGFGQSEDYQPLLWVRGYPVTTALFLVVLHCAVLIACCLLGAFSPAGGPESYFAVLAFSTDAALHHGAWWQFVSYAFCHVPSVWFLLDMFFLYMWGREVERYFGRRMFLKLYVGLLVTTPLLLIALSALTRVNTAYAGSEALHFGIFIAFVTIYPNVQFFFGILAKWLAVALLAIWTLQSLTEHNLSQLLVVWGSTLIAFFATRYASTGSSGFTVLSNIRERLPQRTVPSGVRPRMKPRRAVDTRGEAVPADVHDSIDPLLEKISRHGLASLTNGERATLEKARVSLLRKERGG